MLKQHERLDAHDLERSDTLEQLPTLPEGIVIPDDLRHLPPDRRSRRVVRWGWWTAVLALLAGGSTLMIMRLSDDTPAEVEAPAPAVVPAYDLKQQAIDSEVAWIERLPDVKEYYVDINQDRVADQNR